MGDAQSDAEKIRNKRLAKLGGGRFTGSNVTPSTSDVSQVEAPPSGVPKVEDNLSSQPPQQQPTRTPPVEPSGPRAAMSAPKGDSVAPLSMKPETPTPTKPISTPQTPNSTTPQHTPQGNKQPASRQGERENLETWEDRTLSSIFRLTVKGQNTADGLGQRLHFVEGVKADLEEQGEPLRVSVGVLDGAIVEAASNLSKEEPFNYLLGCWKRVSRQWRSMSSLGPNDPKFAVIKEARRLCMSYCIFAITMPEMFGRDTPETSPLIEHLLVDPECDSGICHDFLTEASLRFKEDDSIKDALLAAVEQLSEKLKKLSMNDNYKPYMLAIRNLVRYPLVVDAMTKSPQFLPSSITASTIETDTLLGPFFRLSPLSGDVAENYFNGSRNKPENQILEAQRALRMTLQTHQDELFDIANFIIKASKEPRERMLDWLAMTVNLNHKRRAIQVDPAAVATDPFMVNVTVILDRLCEPFMDATFSKIDRIDVAYFRRSPRLDISDETKFNADQKKSDEFYTEQVEGTSNFISELFFLTVAAHRYGMEAVSSKLSDHQKDLQRMEKMVEKFETERHKYTHNPGQLRLFEAALKKYKDQIERGYSVFRAHQGVLLDELTQARSMQFMRYVIVFLIRLASPTCSYPTKPLELPLPEDVPEVFECLPEYFLEVIVDNFKFITRTMPHIITSTQCEELMVICITFLRSSEYIKNPYLKAGLVSILFHGTFGFRGRPKGVLGDLLIGSPFALKHLLHALMQFFIEVESTGAHTQFFDKFNIRYEIFQIIKSVWSNTIYRDNLGTEAKVNLDFFVRFVNLLLNDVTFVLDESFNAFTTIHDLQRELNQPGNTGMDENTRREKEEALSSAQGRAKGYMQLTNETVSMLTLFTETLAKSFTMPEIVQRLADMLDYNLDALVGPKQTNLKVDNPAEYGFRPKDLLADIFDVYLNLRERPNFITAIARDGRSYKPQNFIQAANIMKRFSYKSQEDLQKWEDLAAKVQVAKQADQQAEEDLGEIPDEFLDPLVYTLMEDPVILPTSRVTIDRSTIRSHLLSDPHDPFNRTPLKIEDVLPDTEMIARIEAFKQEKLQQKLAAAVPGEGEPMDTS
ncbi:hypothetical protein P152DRAFT_432509 [Eremomyces bilateralis CBS 781.70]|uniref:U-box domain-containing protein n=1 Tax=Eremomyces bilateralis CBS 781.70 TaxID=1392243 RepID=A0A6G1G996_9PEZI|nr:uncharacterized protein P152DRAFT_432509 [Eremomyces bilateralis CBS 781.70]KAF1814506.1 hypothetical protein P152DRAFT_432509 [Eremomyces bilateralis CBS 781.70]